jgi:hypothetical protein
MTMLARGMVALMSAPSAVRSTCFTVSTAGQAGDGGSVLVRGFDYVADDFRRHEGAHGIVHEDDVIGIDSGIGG